MQEISKMLKASCEGEVHCSEVENMLEQVSKDQLQYLLHISNLNEWKVCDSKTTGVDEKPCPALKCVINRVLSVCGDINDAELMNTAFPCTAWLDVDVIEKMLALPCEPCILLRAKQEYTGHMGQSAFDLAILSNNREVSLFLLDQYIKHGMLEEMVLEENIVGDTVMHIVCSTGATEMATVLINALAGDMHLLEKVLIKRNEGGRTPLSEACDKSHVDTIEAVINSIADDSPWQLNEEVQR